MGHDLRRTLILVLCLAWTLAGLIETAVGLARTEELKAMSPRVLGIPMRGADAVDAITSLLPPGPAREPVPRVTDGAHRPEPWLVLMPGGADSTHAVYIRNQLAHLRYPRPVDVLTLDGLDPGMPYTAVVTAPGIILDDRAWRESGQADGWRAYRKAER